MKLLHADVASRRKGLGALAQVLVTVVGVVCLAGCDRPRSLDEGDEIARPWQRATETLEYSLALDQGEMATLILQQRGVDLVVVVDGGGGQPFEVDSPSGRHGDETVVLVAIDRKTRYRLTLRPLTPVGDAEARFSLRVRERRVASARDIAWAGAEEGFHRARVIEEERRTTLDRAADVGFSRAAAAFADLGLVERQADALFLRGKLLHRALQFADAADAYRASLGLSERPDSWVQLASVSMTLGRWNAAQRAYERALDLYAGAGGSAEGSAWKGLGDLQRRRGHFSLAADYLGRAYDIFERRGPRSRRLSTLNSQGMLLLSQGAPQRALPLVERALREAAVEDVETRSKSHSVLADIHMNLGDFPRAQEHLEAALQLESGLRSPRQGVLWVGLGRLAEHRRDVAAARTWYERALARFDELATPLDAAISRSNLAWLLLEEGEHAAARGMFMGALETLEPLGDSALEAVIRFGLAKVARAEGDFRLAEDEIQASIEGVELLRGRSAFKERMSVVASRYDVFSFYIDLLMQQHRRAPQLQLDRIALAVSEQSKARSLLDALDTDVAVTDGRRAETGGESDHPGAEPWAIVRELSRTTFSLELRLRRLSREGATAATLVPLRKELERTVRELARRQGQLRRQHPKLAAARQPRILALPAIQRSLLDGETLLLSYHLGPEGATLWVVGHDSVRSFDLGSGQALESLVRALNRRMELRNLPGRERYFGQTLERLGAAMLPPPDALAGARRLVIVPSGELFRVPFAALPWPVDGSPPGAATTIATAPLLERFEVVLLPSSSVLAASRSRSEGRSTPSRRLAIFADPVFGAEDHRLEGQELPPRPASALDLPRLPATADEAASVAEAMDHPSNWRVLGHGARRDNVLGGALAEFRNLHFATHGIAHGERPELSSLILSQITADGQWTDGRLTARQLADLDLGADLVVVSACRSGPGRPVRGEGLTGLARSFLLAGARRVMVSLWQVDDRAAAELMRRFYLLYGKGVPAAAALRRAQEEMRHSDAWNDPYYWAGFVLFGDWQ